MSRVAVDNNAAFFGGMSRLPRPVAQGQQPGSYQPKMQNGSTQKPSKLQQMQAEYQQNIMREKEQKLISLYEENQQRALQKVNQNGVNKGIVRDFFQERRALGSGNSQGHMNQPSIEKMFHQKKVEHKLSQQSMGRSQSYNPSQVNGRTNQSNIPILSQTQKTSAGRDRSNLLAPIQGPGKRASPGNPFPNKPQIVRPRTYKDVSLNNANKVERSRLPVSAPTGTMVTDSSSEDSPPPNRQQLQMLQQKRKMIKNQQMNRPQATQQPQKKTDFQKFQEEQDQNRANRLNRYREAQAVPQKHQQFQDDEGFDDDSVESDDIDPEDEIKKKQAMLLQQIENQQRELERLRKERMQEEIEEKKEKARRKKLEEERKRREKEEEEWRRKAEEDERVKRTWEEERGRKKEEEKERLRKRSQTTGYEYEDSGDEDDFRRPSPPPQKHRASPPQQQYKPAAPSKPKPMATRKYHPPKSRTPPRQDSPPIKGDHLALYSTADQQEGAFENVGKLVSCFNCGRKFAEDRIEKHEQFCKNLTKKRKVLDPTKLRTQGTEMAQYVNTKQSKPKPKKSNWREKHESFMNAIKYAKKCKEIEDKGGSLADLPPPPRSENPDYVQCPYCTRRFNPQTAERHIPHCKNTKSRPGPPPRKR